MSSCFGSSQRPGQLNDTKSKSIGRVNTFGQIAVKFHEHPKGLESWFENAQRDFSTKCPIRAKRAGVVHQKLESPGPRLHIAIHICGSRGDVQPFIPIAKLLQAPPYGHRVRICTHPAFKEFVVRIRASNMRLPRKGTDFKLRRAMASNSSRLEATQKPSWHTW